MLRRIGVVLLALLLFFRVAPRAAGVELVAKPADRALERRARTQPTVPEGWKESPFRETAPEPVLAASEKQRGFLLFQRPITEPVYPNTRPLSHERLERLAAFATPGEFEPVTFSIYPVRDIANLKVRVSPLTGSGGTIDASCLTVRLATYWNVAFPRYSTTGTHRRVPELLERVTVHSSPALECLRYWIDIHMPDDAAPGIYRGTVTVWDDGFEKAIAIPLSLRVLGFPLQSDPAKHYSAYYYPRSPVQYEGRDEAYFQKASANEYRAMVEYGLDMLPTFYLNVDKGCTRTFLQDEEEVGRMLKAGLKGPLPVCGGRLVSAVYRKTTPGGKRGSHWEIDKMPPPAFDAMLTKLLRAFGAECRAKGWPEVILCPIDEVAASRKEFGARVYAAVKKAGIRTYATKDPRAADAAPYRSHLDIWCSQPFSVPYEKVVAQDRYEYWSYPNHNAGERKDRRIMCLGGRMTYGFGFWRSGYTTLIPWHWSWTMKPGQFDYLRSRRSGCGQRLDENGEVIPAIYWGCFREGRDDARYVYTLQQAVWEREGATDAGCCKLLEEARAALQEAWDAIDVQPRYLGNNTWPSEEFNARRWRLAALTEALLAHPATCSGAAPSVLVEDTSSKRSADSNAPSALDVGLRLGTVEAQDLGGDFAAWKNVTKEGRAERGYSVGLNGKRGLRWQVKVDHLTDGGGEKGAYPVGWPRIARRFGKNELDMTEYDYLRFTLRVDSDRDEVADDATIVGFNVGSVAKAKGFFEVRKDLGDRQREWIPVTFRVEEMIEKAGMGPEPWRNISRIQVFISESNYAHGDNLTFDIGEVQLLRFAAPTILGLKMPRIVTLPRVGLPVLLDIEGVRDGAGKTHGVEASLCDADGKTHAHNRQSLDTLDVLRLDTSSLAPGAYILRVAVTNPSDRVVSESTAPLDAIAGPFYPRTAVP